MGKWNKLTKSNLERHVGRSPKGFQNLVVTGLQYAKCLVIKFKNTLGLQIQRIKIYL